MRRVMASNRGKRLVELHSIEGRAGEHERRARVERKDGSNRKALRACAMDLDLDFDRFGFKRIERV